MAKRPQHSAAVELVRRAKSGDGGAFGELVRRYRQRIYALALHMTGDVSDAEDVTQDVFLRAYRALHRFEERSQFFTWLYRMAINRSLNLFRSRRRRRETGMDDPRVELAVAVDAAGDPDRAAALRQTYSRLLAALDGLPAEMRASVVLVTLQGLSHAEAALLQRVSPGTIAWRIHEARRRLRETLVPESLAARAEDRSAPSTELAELLRKWGWPIVSPF